MADLNALSNTLIAGDAPTLTTLVQAAVDEGMDAKEILNDGLIKGMDIVGEKMQNGDMFIPEVLMSSKAMAASVVILKGSITGLLIKKVFYSDIWLFLYLSKILS
jgi:5-methyltetrahydrofolate--homocysteine methyltransferase